MYICILKQQKKTYYAISPIYFDCVEHYSNGIDTSQSDILPFDYEEKSPKRGYEG